MDAEAIEPELPTLSEYTFQLEELVEAFKKEILELKDKLNEAEGRINELEYLARQEKKHG